MMENSPVVGPGWSNLKGISPSWDSPPQKGPDKTPNYRLNGKKEK